MKPTQLAVRKSHSADTDWVPTMCWAFFWEFSNK